MGDTDTVPVSNYASIKHIFLSFLIWTLCYLLVRRIFIKQKVEWCCRFISFFHAIISIVMDYNVCVEGEWQFSHDDFPTNGKHQFAILFSLGYFIYDLTWCLLNQSETLLMIIHHTYSCFVLTRTLYKKTSGGQIVCGLAMLESSNPFLQLRWFIRSAGYRYSKWFYIAETLFIIVFVMARIIFGTYILFSSICDWEIRLYLVSIYIISLFFLRDIVEFVYYKYFTDE